MKIWLRKKYYRQFLVRSDGNFYKGCLKIILKGSHDYGQAYGKKEVNQLLKITLKNYEEILAAKEKQFQMRSQNVN